MRRRCRAVIIVGGLTCSLAVGTLRAADVSMVQVSSGDGNAQVNLDNWGWDAATPLQVFADESWMTPGQFSINVDFMADQPGRDTLITVPTTFTKSVTNITDFYWNAFTTTIIPSPGATISMVTAQPSAYFGNYQIIDNNDGSFSIEWDNFGNNGTGVPINSQGVFDFSFEVTGPTSQLVNYKLSQIPAPEPATAILLTLTGSAIILRSRRRRNH